MKILAIQTWLICTKKSTAQKVDKTKRPLLLSLQAYTMKGNVINSYLADVAKLYLHKMYYFIKKSFMKRQEIECTLVAYKQNVQ